ncbi:MAG: hypothetical protein Q9219_005306 [cf. Caloplaca sp. 3 TL-2023]
MADSMTDGPQPVGTDPGTADPVSAISTASHSSYVDLPLSELRQLKKYAERCELNGYSPARVTGINNGDDNHLPSSDELYTEYDLVRQTILFPTNLLSPYEKSPHQPVASPSPPDQPCGKPIESQRLEPLQPHTDALHQPTTPQHSNDPPESSRPKTLWSCLSKKKITIGVLGVSMILLISSVLVSWIHASVPKDSAGLEVSKMEADIRAWTKDLMVQTGARITNDDIDEGAENLDTIMAAVKDTDQVIQAPFGHLVDEARTSFDAAQESIQNLYSAFSQRNESWPVDYAVFSHRIKVLRDEQARSKSGQSGSQDHSMSIQHRVIEYAKQLRGELLALNGLASVFDESVGRWSAALTAMEKLASTTSNSHRAAIDRICSSFRWKLFRFNQKNKQRHLAHQQQADRAHVTMNKATRQATVIRLESADFLAELRVLVDELDKLIHGCQFENQCGVLLDKLLPINRQLAELGVRIILHVERSEGESKE